MTQPIRRSQFITTYGPGAILEGPDGPRLIPTLGDSHVFDGRSPNDFEITDQRLSQALLNGFGILRLPSNAEVNEPDLRYIYRTYPFPSWSLCVQHGILYRKASNDTRSCPRCPLHTGSGGAWRRARRDSIRFVRACASGHLDDVDWVRSIPHMGNGCTPSYLFWRGGGGALRQIDIVCPDCQGRLNLGNAYSRDWRCSGRLPEQGSFRPGGCTEPSKVIQRGAANLRIAELRTALTIPPRYTRLHRLLEMSVIRSALVAAQPGTRQELLRTLGNLVANGLLMQPVVDEIETYSGPAILCVIRDTLSGVTASNERELRLEEFRALQTAAKDGAPPQPSPTPGSPPQFEVIQQNVRTVVAESGLNLRVTPVNRLRVVMVQTGYRRLGPLNTPVDLAFVDGSRQWYPGVELFGEGIFVDLLPSAPSDQPLYEMKGHASNTWLDAWNSPSDRHQQAMPHSLHELHPVFVWWHTLSHRLINSLAIDSGYSSASIRERVFVDIDDQTGNATGGVLLYTAQPGGDGTLGGLIALVPQFERVFSVALRELDSCSNDPLCGEEAFDPGKYNGPACYSCALISETSCEHRNMKLDRKLLLDNL